MRTPRRRVTLAAAGSLAAAATPAAIVLSLRQGDTFGAVFSAAFLAYAVMGVLILWSRPGNPIGRLLLVLGLMVPLSQVAASYAVLGFAGARWVAWLSELTFPFVFGGLLIFLPLLFPTGSFLSPAWRRFGVATLIGLALLTVVLALTPGPLDCCTAIRNPLGLSGAETLRGLAEVSFPLVALAAVGAFVSLGLRYRRSRGEERLQIKWLVLSVAWILVAAIGGAVETLGGVSESDLAPLIIYPTGAAAIALAVGIAVLKYRLYDIDIVINKALVYGALAAFITALYVGVVVGIGTLLGTRGEGSLGLQIGATALVAVLFQPVRSRIQHLANRLVYGARSTPYEVMAAFGGRMAGSLRVEEVLPQMADAAARGVGAAAARARIELSGGEVREARWPAGGETEGTERVLAVTHRGEPVGEIAVTKAPGDPLRPQDEALLRDLAAQAGLALHNVRLAEELRARVEQISLQTEELRASQQRIVTAADEERRLLERTIEERVERRIEDLAERVRSATGFLLEDPDRSTSLLEESGARAQTTLEALREIARGIYPPLLADKGLAVALDAQAGRASGPVRLRTEGVGRYSQEVEAGIFFCCMEAIHQTEDGLAIDLRGGDGAVRFTIELAGAGDAARVVRIRDRVEALGGTLEVRSGLENGTIVTARIPTMDRERAG